MFNRKESKNKINKKSFNRRLKSRNRYSSVTNLKSFDFFVIFLLNDTNQSTTKNKNEENEQIKMSNTMKSYFKAINFFQNVSLTKDRYNIKLDFENSVSLYYYDRQFAKKNQQYLVFINKEKFLKKAQINFQLRFESAENVTMYFRKFQKVITQFMTHYDALRKNYKTFKKNLNDLREQVFTIFEDKNVIISLQEQLKLNQEISIKQIKIIKRHRQKRLITENRQRKMIEKLLKTFQQLKNCQKKHASQHNIININDFTFLLYTSRDLNTDKISFVFQNKLVDTALS